MNDGRHISGIIGLLDNPPISDGTFKMNNRSLGGGGGGLLAISFFWGGGGVFWSKRTCNEYDQTNWENVYIIYRKYKIRGALGSLKTEILV